MDGREERAKQRSNSSQPLSNSSKQRVVFPAVPKTNQAHFFAAAKTFLRPRERAKCGFLLQGCEPPTHTLVVFVALRLFPIENPQTEASRTPELLLIVATRGIKAVHHRVEVL
jgi:hypothetical protein